MSMNRGSTVARCSALAAVVLALGVAAWSGRPHAQQFQQSQRQDAPLQPTLHDLMEEINEDFRTLFRAVSDPAKRADSLTLMAELQDHFVAAKSLTPHSVESVPAAERDAFATAFRRSMAEMLRELVELELEIIDGKTDEAMKRIRETIVPMRDAAHEKFGGESD